MPVHCDACGTAMKPLFYMHSLFCPKGCDLRAKEATPKSPWIRYKDSKWYYVELRTGDLVPPTATHGWWLGGGDASIDMCMDAGPWELAFYHLYIGSTVSRPLRVLQLVP